MRMRAELERQRASSYIIASVHKYLQTCFKMVCLFPGEYKTANKCILESLSENISLEVTQFVL